MSDGTGRIYKRGETWWIDYSFRGKRHRESSGSTRKGDATKLLRRRMSEMGRGQLVGPDAEKLTFEDMARMIEDDYEVQRRRSTKQLRSTIKRLRRFFGDDMALAITTDRMKSYAATRQKEGYAPGTIRKDLAALKRMFNLAVEAERLPYRPHVPAIRVDDARENFLTMAEVDAIAQEIGPDLAALVRFAALTGWRRTECRTLQWRQVDFEARTVRLVASRSKNAEARTFPFATYPPLEELLRGQQQRTRDVERRRGRIVPHVFHRDGEPVKSFRDAWNNAAEAAGCPGAWFHDMRRTAVVNLERAGVPRSVAMKLTGHKTESVYKRYAIADLAALEEGVTKLARLHESRGGGTDTAQSGASNA